MQGPVAGVGGTCANDAEDPKEDATLEDDGILEEAGILDDGDADKDTEGDIDGLDNDVVALLGLNVDTSREVVVSIRLVVTELVVFEPDPGLEEPWPRNGALALHS